MVKKRLQRINSNEDMEVYSVVLINEAKNFFETIKMKHEKIIAIKKNYLPEHS